MKPARAGLPSTCRSVAAGPTATREVPGMSLYGTLREPPRSPVRVVVATGDEVAPRVFGSAESAEQPPPPTASAPQLKRPSGGLPGSSRPPSGSRRFAGTPCPVFRPAGLPPPSSLPLTRSPEATTTRRMDRREGGATASGEVRCQGACVECRSSAAVYLAQQDGGGWLAVEREGRLLVAVGRDGAVSRDLSRL